MKATPHLRHIETFSHVAQNCSAALRDMRENEDLMRKERI
ncbi:hypothetical protein GGI64_002785 [Rhizobium leguminosarum]|uniref:Uncharacterized protein n=1 Tax=Rhizobium leguminosarum TaxID=384 RepID=A0A7Z0DYG9_RHILE|nr:hypothetical protein [Rhizobium leguminosarum]